MRSSAPFGGSIRGPPRRACVLSRRAAYVMAVVAKASEGTEDPVVMAVMAEAAKVDVSDACVKPLYRTLTTLQETEAVQESRTKARICFLSESNICRSLFAEAILNKLLEEYGLADEITCESRGTQNYCVGEGPDALCEEVAKEMGLTLSKPMGAQHFDESFDIVYFDLLLAMDKYTLADTMREITVYDTITSSLSFSSRIRHMAEFRPLVWEGKKQKPKDIEDPLYGNKINAECVRQVVKEIEECCEGLVKALSDIKFDNMDNADMPFRTQLINYTSNLKEVEWLKPPMLTPRQFDDPTN